MAATATAVATGYISAQAMMAARCDLVEHTVHDCVRKLEAMVGDDPIEIAVISPTSPRCDSRQFTTQTYQVIVTNDPEYARWRLGGEVRGGFADRWALRCLLEVNDA